MSRPLVDLNPVPALGIAWHRLHQRKVNSALRDRDIPRWVLYWRIADAAMHQLQLAGGSSDVARRLAPFARPALFVGLPLGSV